LAIEEAKGYQSGVTGSEGKGENEGIEGDNKGETTASTGVRAEAKNPDRPKKGGKRMIIGKRIEVEHTPVYKNDDKLRA